MFNVDFWMIIVLILIILLGIVLFLEYHLEPGVSLNGNLYHYTKMRNINSIVQGDNSIYLKVSKKWCSPTGVYFFQERPGLLDRFLLRLQNCNVVVIIKASEVKDKSKLFLRSFDKTVVYQDEYRGSGYIEKVDFCVFVDEIK